MITYCINSPVGKEASGIPSLDVAVAIAVDFARYGFVYDDGTCDDEDEPWRRADIVVEDCENDWGQKFKMLYVGGREHYGIHEENRCDTCRRPL